jgi:hypothetical protein
VATTYDPYTKTNNTAMATLQPGQVVRLRYATKRSSSNQGRGVRKVHVVQGAHDDEHFKRGPIITVADLSDPHKPGQLKNLYVHRISEIEGMSDSDSDSDSGEDDDSGSDSDSEEESVDAGDLVTVSRADTVDGIVVGRVLARQGRVLTVKAPDSRRTCKVDRRHVRKTSIATINRKVARRKYGRRKRGLGPVV